METSSLSHLGAGESEARFAMAMEERAPDSFHSLECDRVAIVGLMGRACGNGNASSLSRGARVRRRVPQKATVPALVAAMNIFLRGWRVI